MIQTYATQVADTPVTVYYSVAPAPQLIDIHAIEATADKRPIHIAFEEREKLIALILKWRSEEANR